MMAPKKAKARRWPFVLLGVLVLCYALIWLSQSVIAHWVKPFIPKYPQEDLSPILAQRLLSPRDYELLFLQTGLGKSAVDSLLGQGALGVAQILDLQTQFFLPRTEVCTPLFGPIVGEDHIKDSDGNQTWAPPMVALENGDVMLTLSTHSFGWRHGHAGLVVDEENGVSLEAVVIGSDSALVATSHWRAYSSYMVLRLRDMTPELRTELVQYAMEKLTNVPYHLTSGFFGDKAQNTESPYFGIQCSYLVWHAFQNFGYDLDSDSGRLVSVNDLSRSPLFEIVQLYGMDPRDWM